MNTLSWLLYLADIVGTFNATARLICFFSAGVLLFTGFACVATDREKFPHEFAACSTIRKYSFFILVVFITLNLVVPSPRTVYLIVASEIGEEVVVSDEIQEIKDIVMDKIREYGEEPNKENP